jgi:hypothetical protein
MQMLAGVITEGEYTAIINKQIEEADKESLNESMIGGIVGVGAITQIPATPKTDYEMAFEHFLGERYENREQDLKEEDTVEDMEERTEEEVNEDDSYNDMDQQISDEVNEAEMNISDDYLKEFKLALGKIMADSKFKDAEEALGLKIDANGRNMGEVFQKIWDKAIKS